MRAKFETLNVLDVQERSQLGNQLAVELQLKLWTYQWSIITLQKWIVLIGVNNFDLFKSLPFHISVAILRHSELTALSSESYSSSIWILYIWFDHLQTSACHPSIHSIRPAHVCPLTTKSPASHVTLWTFFWSIHKTCVSPAVYLFPYTASSIPGGSERCRINPTVIVHTINVHKLPWLWMMMALE